MSTKANAVEEINVMGKTYFPVDSGYSVRVPLDRDLSMLAPDSPLEASFVLGLTLRTDGSVSLTQAGGLLAQQGLVLTTADEEIEITPGAALELTKLLGLHFVEMRHPKGSGTLSFHRKVYPGNKKVLALSWHAGPCS